MPSIHLGRRTQRLNRLSLHTNIPATALTFVYLGRHAQTDFRSSTAPKFCATASTGRMQALIDVKGWHRVMGVTLPTETSAPWMTLNCVSLCTTLDHSCHWHGHNLILDRGPYCFAKARGFNDEHTAHFLPNVATGKKKHSETRQLSCNFQEVTSLA